MKASERTFYIYCHTAPNGKRYIGQTCQKPSARWSHGKGYRGQPYFSKAVAKYGWDNFKHDILCVVHSKKMADLFEQYYIEKFNTFNSEHGYNLTKGGGGSLGHRLSNEAIEKLRKLNVGRSPTEEQRKQISETLKSKYASGELVVPEISEEALKRMSKERMGAGNPMFGRHHSYDARERIREAQTGRTRSEETKRRISESRYKSPNIKRCPVCQYDFEGNLIARYNSLKEAQEITGFAASNIGNCARGKYKQAYGFLWRYEELAA